MVFNADFKAKLEANRLSLATCTSCSLLMKGEELHRPDQRLVSQYIIPLSAL